MNAILINLDEIFIWVARASLYAVAVIAVIVLVQTLARRALAAKWIFALWAILLLRLVIPVGPESGWSLWNLAPRQWTQQILFEPDSAPAISGGPAIFAPSAAGNEATILPVGGFSLWSTLRTFLPVVWLAGALFIICSIIIGDIRLWNTVRRLPFVTDHALLEILEECRQSMRIWTVVGLVVTDRVKSPILFGFIRPRILLPSDLARDLPPERLRYVLLHELAHLKRRDILTGWILAFLQALHWFNPLVWWAFSRIRFDRELACDEQALSRIPNEERRHYGDVLIGMLERFNHIHHLPAIAGILENKKQLKRRLVMIRKFRRPARSEIIAFTALLAVLSIALLTEPRPLLSQFQSNEQSDYASTVSEIAIMDGDEDKLALGDMKVAEFYLERGNIAAALKRLQHIVENYKNFKYMDAVLERIDELYNRLGEESDQTFINSGETYGGGMPDGLLPPEILFRLNPIYTEEARAAKIQGIVVLQVLIRKDGAVDVIEVLQGLGYGLDEAAIDAMTDWRFSPATHDGVPIDITADIEIKFALF